MTARSTPSATTTSANPSATPPVDTYGLTLPNAWQRLPLDPAEQQAAKRDAVKTLSAHDDWSKAMERQLDLSIARVNHQLSEINAVFAAAYWDVWDADASQGEDPEATAEMVSATCVIGTMSKEDLGTEFDLTAGLLLGAVVARKGDVEQRPETTGVDVEPPIVVELAAGRAVRVRRHYEVVVDLSRRVGLFAESYLVPHGADGERICVVGFTTTRPDMAPDFSTLFERMAGTLRFFREGDDTVGVLTGSQQAPDWNAE